MIERSEYQDIIDENNLRVQENHDYYKLRQQIIEQIIVTSNQEYNKNGNGRTTDLATAVQHNWQQSYSRRLKLLLTCLALHPNQQQDAYAKRKHPRNYPPPALIPEHCHPRDP